MYWAEKFLYQDQLSQDPERKKHWQDTIKKYGGENALIRETGKTAKGTKAYRLNDKASDTPKAPGSLYEQNDRFIEFNTALEDKRGFLTFGFLVLLPATLQSLSLALLVAPGLITFTDLDGSPLSVTDYILTLILFLITMLLPLCFAYAVYRFGRLEFFTQRRLLVRFDRVNRKVYLHRPKYAGGVVELDWEKGAVSLQHKDEKNGSDLGVPLSIVWENTDTPNGLFEMPMVGRMAQSETELYDRWEFIRRFMEEGADSVPEQKTISKFPMPWNSIMAIFGIFWMFRSKGLRILLPLIVILSPFILLIAFAHWLSLLLCYEPVFPKAIRDKCGESFGAVIRARFIDLIAWAMLAGVIWAFMPFFQSIFSK